MECIDPCPREAGLREGIVRQAGCLPYRGVGSARRLGRQDFLELKGRRVPAEALLELLAAGGRDALAQLGVVEDALDAPDDAVLAGVDQDAVLLVLGQPLRRVVR